MTRRPRRNHIPVLKANMAGGRGSTAARGADAVAAGFVIVVLVMLSCDG